MEQIARLSGDALTSIDRAALKGVARRLWPVHRELAAEWARRLLVVMPPAVANGVALTVAVLSPGVVSHAINPTQTPAERPGGGKVAILLGTKPTYRQPLQPSATDGSFALRLRGKKRKLIWARNQPVPV